MYRIKISIAISVIGLLMSANGSMAQGILFHRGVNLTNWFQARSPGAIQFGKYSKADFENIQSLGCDVIRLPINLHSMTQGAPEYRPDPLFLTFLDSAVTWAEDLGLHLILDNHTFDPSSDTDPAVEDILVKVWGHLAQYYKDRYENIYYEILNEPHGIDDAVWGEIQRKAIEAIRVHDQDHTIIVGGANWNSFHNLEFIPEYDDDNLIYTFHFYDPFLFSHQGSTWNTPSMDEIKGIPFPYEAANMPPLHSKYNGTWIQSIYDNYPEDGVETKVRDLIDIAVAFREERNVPIFCGEFGVYDVVSDPDDRVYWYKVVREYLEENDIPWTMWDYHGGFGVFRKGEEGLFDHNLNTQLLESLDLNIPEQTPYQRTPDTTGFHMYDDYLHPDIDESSYGAGTINYYAQDEPNYGRHCIRWNGPEQYNIIGLDFVPDKDLTTLVEQGYFLNFFVRSTASDIRFDVRFLDTDTGESDQSWRNRFTINLQSSDEAGAWQQVQVPLSQFTEQGAWEAGQWYNPEGKFQWENVDRFEISTEAQGYPDDTIWIDQLVVTNRDTAAVFTSSVLGLERSSLSLYPNPCADQLYLSRASSSEKLRFRIVDVQGKLHFEGVHSDALMVVDTMDWSPGIYYLSGLIGHQQRIAGSFVKL